MIQRIQTLYLLLAFLAIALTFFFDMCQFALEGSDRLFFMDLFSIRDAADEGVGVPAYRTWNIVLLSFTGLLLMLAIFSYKQRKRQLKLVHFSYLLEAGTIVLFFFSMEASVQRLPIEEGTVATSYGMGWLMPAVAVAFSFLAARGIKKDEELVRSVDRLR